MSSHLYIGNPTYAAYPTDPFRIHNTNTTQFRVRTFPQLARGKYRRTTISILSEDTLLEIFDFYRLDAMQQTQSPWKWHRLAHVCRKWRHVISMSPHRLDLRILCNPLAPFERILCSWPALPLVLRFNWESAHLPKRIMIALGCSDRICEINLDVTGSVIGPIVNSIRKECQALESIRIAVVDVTGPPKLVRNAFLGGSAPHLRELKLDGIALPFRAIRKVLLSTNNLVELDLPNIPVSGYFSPRSLVTALSASVKLRRLTVGFHYPASLPLQSRTSPPPQYATLPSLPSLVFLGFHGASEYLEELVAQVGFPALHDTTIRLFNQIFFEIPQFCQLTSRLDALKSPNLVMIAYSAESVKVSLIQTGMSLDGDCILSTSCRQLDWQLFFVTQVLNQFSPLLSGVRSLSFEKSDESPTGKEDVDSTQWLELLQPFSHVSQVLVWEKQLLPGIVQALATEGTEAGVLPQLTSLYLSEYCNFPSVAKAAEQFVSTRRLSGRTVYLYG